MLTITAVTTQQTHLGRQVADKIVELLQIGAVLRVLVRQLHQRVCRACELCQLFFQLSVLRFKNLSFAEDCLVFGLNEHTEQRKLL